MEVGSETKWFPRRIILQDAQFSFINLNLDQLKFCISIYTWLMFWLCWGNEKRKHVNSNKNCDKSKNSTKVICSKIKWLQIWSGFNFLPHKDTTCLIFFLGNFNFDTYLLFLSGSWYPEFTIMRIWYPFWIVSIWSNCEWALFFFFYKVPRMPRLF